MASFLDDDIIQQCAASPLGLNADLKPQYEPVYAPAYKKCPTQMSETETSMIDNGIQMMNQTVDSDFDTDMLFNNLFDDDELVKQKSAVSLFQFCDLTNFYSIF